MALGTTNTNLTQIAVKRLSGKAMTNSNLSIPEEGFGSTVQTAALTVFGEVLPNSPATGSENLFLIQSQSNSHPGTVMLVDFDITPINDSQYQNVLDIGDGTNVLNYTGDQGETNINTFHAYVLSLTGSFHERITSLGATYFSTNASTPVTLGNAPFTGSFTTTGSVQLQIVPEFVSTINGSTNPYIPQISKKQSPETFEGASALSANNGTAAIDYYLDPFSGLLFVQDPVSFSDGLGNVPGKVRAFIYVGKYQTDVVSGETVDLHISASSGTGFSIANKATASFESGSAGITVTADSSQTITIGDSSDNVFFNDISASGNLFVSKSIFIDGGGGYNDATIEVISDTLEIKDSGNLRLAMDGDGNTPNRDIRLGTGSGTSFQTLMIVSGSGNVGIGTTSPTHTLSVAGDISASGDLFIDNINASLLNARKIEVSELIVSSSVSYITSSFSSGSNIFGDTMDDKHRFTGSLFVTGNVDIDSGSLRINTFNEGLEFFNGSNYTGNRIKLTPIQNMQFSAGASFQFNPSTGQVQILDAKKFQLNTEGNASKARIAATSGSVTDQVRLDIENAENEPKVSIITSGSAGLEGNVGIGTIIPEQLLTVKGGNILVTGSNSTTIELSSTNTGASAQAELRLTSFRTGSGAGSMGSSRLFKTGSSTRFTLDEDLTIRNNNKTSLVINGAGDINFVSASQGGDSGVLTSYLFGDNENKRIGIGGITTPAHELDITGSARIRGPFSQLRLLNDSNSDNIEIGVSDGGDAFIKRGDNNGLIRFRDVDNVDVMTIAFSPTTHNKKVIISGSISASISASIGKGDRLNIYSDATNSTIDTVNNRLRFRTYRTQDYIEFKPNNSIELIISDSGSKFSSNITASSDISSSGKLFFSSSLNSSTSLKTLVYDTDTGQIFHTGSYGGGGGGTATLAGISASIHAATGSLSASITGVTYEIEVTNGGTPGNVVIGLPDQVRISSSLLIGTNAADPAAAALTTTHTGTFNLIDDNTTTINFGGDATTINMGAAGNSNVNIKGSASIDGDLIVKGEVTTINTTELNVEDPFILLNSGSTSGDGGIIVQTGTNGIGTALFYDDDQSRWGLTKADDTAFSATTATPRQYVVSVSSSAAAPTGNPSDFGGSAASYYGMMYVDTSDSAGDKNTIWIYG